jgi:formylglycine-generating enzyme
MMMRIARLLPAIAFTFGFFGAACSSDPPVGGADAGAETSVPAKSCPTDKGPSMLRVPAGDKTVCIDTTEVTRAQYAAFLADVNASGEGKVARDPLCSGASFEVSADCLNESSTCKNSCSEHPQVCVSWCAAFSYCKWAGKKLCGSLDGSVLTGSRPDLQQVAWLNVCGGGVRADGLPNSLYPYGDSYKAGVCNTDACAGGACTTAPVGSLKGCQGTGPYAGLFDMVGNASEWVDERGNGSARSVGQRGSSFSNDSDVSGCNIVGSAGPDVSSPGTGIRCCAD